MQIEKILFIINIIASIVIIIRGLYIFHYNFNIVDIHLFICYILMMILVYYCAYKNLFVDSKLKNNWIFKYLFDSTDNYKYYLSILLFLSIGGLNSLVIIFIPKTVGGIGVSTENLLIFFGLK